MVYSRFFSIPVWRQYENQTERDMDRLHFSGNDAGIVRTVDGNPVNIPDPGIGQHVADLLLGIGLAGIGAKQHVQ